MNCFGLLKKRPLWGLFLSAVFLTGHNYAADLDDARNVVSEWVSVEKLISEERSGWSAEEAVITDMISLLKGERDSLNERIKSAGEAMSGADEKRIKLVDERSEYVDAMDFLGENIESLEAKIVDLHKRFPPPLQEEVSVSFERIPELGAKTRLTISQRLQTIVVVLSQADKFNGGIQMISEIQDIGEGQAEVSILYFGLGGAYFQDEEGKYSGVGYPSSDGWVWEPVPDKAKAISDLFAVYSGSKEAEFVQLPVTIK